MNFPGFPVFSRREMGHFSRFPAGNSKPRKCPTLIVHDTFKSTFPKFHYLDILNNFQTSHRVKLQIDLFENLNLVISKFNTLISINSLK